MRHTYATAPQTLSRRELDDVLADLVDQSLAAVTVETHPNSPELSAVVLHTSTFVQVAFAAAPGEPLIVRDEDDEVLSVDEIGARWTRTVKSARALHRGHRLVSVFVELDRGALIVDAGGPSGLRAGALRGEPKFDLSLIDADRFAHAATGRTIVSAEPVEHPAAAGAVAALSIRHDDGTVVAVCPRLVGREDDAAAVLIVDVDDAGNGRFRPRDGRWLAEHLPGRTVVMPAVRHDEAGETTSLVIAFERGGLMISAQPLDPLATAALTLLEAVTAVAEPTQATSDRDVTPPAGRPGRTVTVPSPDEIKRIVRSMRGGTLAGAALTYREGPDFPPTGAWLRIPDGRDAMILTGQDEPFVARDGDIVLDDAALEQRTCRTIKTAWATIEDGRPVRMTFELDEGTVIIEATGPTGLNVLLADPNTSIAHDVAPRELCELVEQRRIARVDVHQQRRFASAVPAIGLRLDDGTELMIAGRLVDARHDGDATLTFGAGTIALDAPARRDPAWIAERLNGLRILHATVDTHPGGQPRSVTLTGTRDQLTIAVEPLLSDRPAALSICRVDVDLRAAA